jgi:UDP-GlcNAc:undecaprenyl-phosphate/decaprenyl-phosphate GlcNAc-1-phosphate transferase
MSLMKFKLIALSGILLLAFQVSAIEKLNSKVDKEKQGYAVGVDLARNLKRQGIAVDADALAKGLRDELAGSKLSMTEDELKITLNAFQTELKQRRARGVRTVAEDNKRQGEAFLAENKTKEGVVTLPNGLQYKVLKEGDGKKPTEADAVEVNYRGTLIDGTEFDNSHLRGKPVTLKPTGGTLGWTQALKLMPVSSKWQIFIPPQLAYGEKGLGHKIGPNATLIFEVELLAIK